MQYVCVCAINLFHNRTITFYNHTNLTNTATASTVQECLRDQLYATSGITADHVTICIRFRGGWGGGWGIATCYIQL